MIKWDGFYDAIIGQALIWRDSSLVEVLVYDGERIQDILMQRDGMSSEDAREYIDHNITCAYVGLETPVLVWPADLDFTDNDIEDNE